MVRQHSSAQKQWLEKIQTSTWIVAKVGRRSVGCSRLVADDKVPDARYIESVWVHPDFRRRGIVRAMVGKLEELAQEAGAQELRLWVLNTNSGAWDAYLKLGFAEEGTMAL